MKDLAFAKKIQGRIILVADDAGPSMRASGVPIVRMQAMSCDAMAKKLFLNLDWHQLRARKQLCPDHTDVPTQCSGKDASVAGAPPCFVANQLFNGTAPESCPLDHSVVA